MTGRTHKRCPRCQATKPLVDFAQKARRVSSYCKPCDRAYSAERQRRYWETHPEMRPRQREQNRAAQFKRKYGITLADYDGMLLAQDGGCAICGSHDVGEGRSHLYVDHCHATGIVRGLLCAPCNRGLGCFADDPERLRCAIDYLTSKGA